MTTKGQSWTACYREVSRQLSISLESRESSSAKVHGSRSGNGTTHTSVQLRLLQQKFSSWSFPLLLEILSRARARASCAFTRSVDSRIDEFMISVEQGVVNLCFSMDPMIPSYCTGRRGCLSELQITSPAPRFFCARGGLVLIKATSDHHGHL